MRTTVLLLCIVLLTGTAPAGDTPCHLRDEASAPLLTRSTFVHGYMHGYDAGFRMGDQDVHFGRQAADPEHAVNRMPKDKVRARGAYREGFGQGFLTGYADAFSGRKFRVLDEIREAAAGVQEAAYQARFDRGFRDGYGEAVATRPVKHPRAAECQVSSPKDAEFCDGFRRGHKLGLRDALLARAHDAGSERAAK